MSPAPIPHVSIGLPVYNGESQLALALDSLIAQTFDDLEIVVSDNHSTDATESICRDFAARDARIHYVRSDRNRGAAWNFNRVFELSHGRYFKWASSNDLHAPDCVRRCVEVLDARPEVVLCYPKTTIIDEGGAVVRQFEDNLDLPWPQAEKRFRAYLQQVRLCNAVFGLIRLEALRRTGRLGNYPGADVVLLAELTLHGTFSEVPEYLFFRRMERQNFVRDESLENWQEFFDPSSRGKIFMRTWRHQYEYFAATLRSPLPLPEKASVAAFIARSCIVHRGVLARELAMTISRLTGRNPVRETGPKP